MVQILFLASSASGVGVAAGVIGVTGLLIGLLLGFAAKAFAVPVDEKEVAVREFLPGNNCGGCGFAGCDALAKAIAAGEAPVNACPVGGAAVAEKIGAVMGVDSGDAVKMVAYVKCAGTCDKAGIKANYYGKELQQYQDVATRHAHLAVLDLVHVLLRASLMQYM